jgi:raffinose/stachyose/melibiose transport system substrate-binding protein
MLYGRDGAAGYAIPAGLDELYAACSDYFASGRDGAFVHIGGAQDIRTLHVLPSMLWADAVGAGIVEELDAGTTTFTDPRIVEAINAVNSGMHRACLNHDDYHTATYESQLERVMDGSAAMIPQGISAVADLIERYGRDAVDERVGFFPLSFRTPRASWGARPDTAFLVPVNDDATRQDAALELVRYALGAGYDELLAASGMPPVLAGVEAPEGLPVPVVEAHEAMLASAAPTIDTVIREPYGDLNQWLYEMLEGTRTPDDVAISMADTFAFMTGG